MNITAGDWYNVTVNVDLANYKVQYIVDGVIISNSTGSGWTSTPTTTATSMGYFAVETTNSVSIRNDFYLDDIQVFTNWNRNYGGMAKTQAIFYRLQEWHQDFDLNIEQGKKYLPTYANKYAYKSDAWAAMGWDIQIAGEWVNNALWCNITVVDSKIDGTNNWVKYNATWYQNVNGANVTIRSDQIVGLYEGYSGMNEESGLKDLTSFHWDIWFNRMNASTVMGGRLNTAYFGVSDKAPWYAFWYNDYKATAADLSSSSVFRRVLYANGTAASVKEVVLVRPWEMIWRSNKEQYHWAIKNIDEQAFRVTSANMEGIDTPAPKKTQMPTVPQSGVGAWLAAAFKGIMAGFGDALTFGAMNVWTSFVGFLDIIAGFFGAPGFFTTLFAQVSTFTGYMITSFLMLTQLVVQMFIFLVYIIPYFMWTVVRWITYILQILAIVKGILDGTGTAVVSLGNLWAMFNMEIIITFIIVLSPIMWMSKLDEESQKGNDWVAVAVEDIQRLMNIFSMLIQFFVSIINLAITVLFAIIESIPVVE
jgi:hypothetical protein